MQSVFRKITFTGQESTINQNQTVAMLFSDTESQIIHFCLVLHRWVVAPLSKAQEVEKRFMLRVTCEESRVVCRQCVKFNLFFSPGGLG